MFLITSFGVFLEMVPSADKLHTTLSLWCLKNLFLQTKLFQQKSNFSYWFLPHHQLSLLSSRTTWVVMSSCPWISTTVPTVPHPSMQSWQAGSSTTLDTPVLSANMRASLSQWKDKIVKSLLVNNDWSDFHNRLIPFSFFAICIG